MDNNTKNHQTEKDILASAKHIFHIKGLSGARMQEIADVAGINKAMLHYYFRSKDKLFEAVFRDAVKNFFPKIFELINTDQPLFSKIENFVSGYIQIILENPCVPGFIINELSQNPQRIKNIFIENEIAPPEKFIHQIIKAIEDKEIIPINPKELMLNIISLCLFPVVAKPIVETALNLTEENYNALIESRKKEVAKFIINAIKLK